MIMLYIQKEIQFWETDAPLPDSYKVGTMEEEYNDGAYLLLDAEQEQFHTDHPEASPLECWRKELTPEPEPTPEELLWRARDAKRQEIILILTDFPGEGLTVNGITERIDLSRPAVSHHLKVLKQAGVIGVRSCGVENHYYLTFKAALRNLKILVAQVEASCDLR